MSNLLSQRPDVGEFRKRYGWLGLAATSLMCALIGKLVFLQVVHHDENAAIAHENIVHRVALATSRGVIRDRNGTVLAASRESWNVYVVPARLDLEKTWPKLAEIIAYGPLEREAIEKRLRQARAEDLAALKKDPKHHIRELIVREDVSRDVVGTLETHKDDLPAVSWLSVPMRYYPTKDLTFHLLGYVNEVNRDDLKAVAPGTLQPGDRIGRSGIEKAFEPYLRGQRGWRKVILDARGNRRTAKEDVALLDEPREEAPIPGRDVRLTIDADLTSAARRAFRGQLAGAVVAVEVKTGRVLVLYSQPAVDPNDFVAGLSVKQAEGIEVNPLHPLVDKAMHEAYFPGSTMKPFTALAGLMSGAINEHTTETCEHVLVLSRTRFKCEGFHGQIGLHDAIVRSCNIFFYQVGKRTTLDVMSAMAAEFGFGQRSGVGLPGETPGLIPTTAWYMQHYGGKFRQGFSLNAAIGQGNTKVTVLQLAMAYAALANGGTLWAPQVVRSIEVPPINGGAGQVEIDFAPRARRQIALRPDALRMVREAMYGVVNEEFGTAYAERTTKVSVAGKTGTAQVSRVGQKSGIDPRTVWYFNRDHAWFAGFAPYDDPEIAVAVLVEHGGGGGHNAAPIAMRVIEEYFAQKNGTAPDGKPGQKPQAALDKDGSGKHAPANP
jgi:penicillin-binding protein 2